MPTTSCASSRAAPAGANRDSLALSRSLFSRARARLPARRVLPLTSPDPRAPRPPPARAPRPAVDRCRYNTQTYLSGLGVSVAQSAGLLAYGVASAGESTTMWYDLTQSGIDGEWIPPPALVGKGAAAYCLGSRCREGDEAVVVSLLDAVGLAVPVPEKLMDAVTGLSGSGPAYVYLMIEALADGGVMAGLSRADAVRLAAQTVSGAAEMVLRTGDHPAKLKDMVTSPGGTTIAGLSVLEGRNVRSALIDAVMAAATRSAELGRG